jgi:hypothetical protein
VGRNARDIKHFVQLFGFEPAEALRAATQYGGQIMSMGVSAPFNRDGLVFIEQRALELASWP